MEAPLVSLQRCEGYEEGEILSAVRRALAPLGGIEAFVRSGMRVVLKPNLLTSRRPEEATTTHPVIVAAVARLIREQGAYALILDGPGGPNTEAILREIYTATGMSAVASQTGADLNFDLTEQPAKPAGARVLKSFSILKPLATADLVINLPKLKTHGQMVYTGAVKNLFGAVPGLMKAHYHLRMADHVRFAHVLIDVSLAAAPRLTLMDGVVAMEGNGPSAGTPRPLHVLLAGTDAFAVDVVAAWIIGLQPTQIPVLKQGIERGLCPPELAAVRLAGPAPSTFAVPDFDVPGARSLEPLQFFDRGLLGWMASHLLRPRPALIPEKCVGCGDCAEICPAKVIRMENQRPSIDLDRCIRCFCCQELCPAKALRVAHPPGGRFLCDHVVPILARLLSRLH